ncbi:hypothetical protein FKP32DRAFT_770439 [Trametes sanguinea]|nr:hypothetical protein FKP32DRAFT_770439 [Trametes sanguinea]
MVLSSNNRKSFPANLQLPSLPHLPFGSSPPSRDSEASRSDRSLRSSFVASPSRASFLSPRVPPLPASLHLKQEQPVIPIPLTDGLDPSEKMKLLRKAKKLSRILGEVPIPVPIDSPAETRDLRFLGVQEEPSLTSASTASSSSLKSPPVFQTTGSLKRSATLGHQRQSLQNGIQRARSLASLRPSLTIPPAAITIHSSPISPVIFSWPEKNPIPPSPLTPITPSDDYGEIDRQSKRDSFSSKRDSVASSIFPSERSPEQVQRARAAKLARQLGENIPPELLIRASSPQPRSPLSSPSMVSFAEASLTIREPPRRASSARPTIGKTNRRDAKRRLSLDLRAFVKVPEPPVPSPALSEPDKYSTVQHKSKHSLAGKKSQTPHDSEPGDTPAEGNAPNVDPVSAAERDSDLESDWDDDCSGPLSLERQRALNVRRARKMLQVFGNEPPPSLFQITNIPPRATEEGISVSLSISHCKRDSRATVVSVSSSQLSVDEARDPQRDSVGTTSSSGENLSPLIFADPGSVPPSQPQTPHPVVAEEDTDSIPALPPLPPSQDTVVEVRPSSPLSVPTIASSSLHSLSLASTASVPGSRAQSLYSQSPQTSPIRPSFQITPPPHATMFLFGPLSAPTSPPLSPPSVLPEGADDIHPSDPHFRMRRLRAAKLSRFFGVGLNDIAGLLRGNSSSAGASAGAPSSPPLREFRRSDASDSIPSPTSLRSSRSARPVTSAGVLDSPSVSSAESAGPRKRTLSSGTRTRSLSRTSRRPQTQPATQPVGERYRSNSQPEVLAQQSHNRVFSTTVEISAESRRPFAFLDGRRPSKAKEMDMHDVIRELRKIK